MYTGYSTTPGVDTCECSGGTSSYTGNPISVHMNASGPYILSLSQFQIKTPFCSSTPINLTVTEKMTRATADYWNGAVYQCSGYVYSDTSATCWYNLFRSIYLLPRQYSDGQGSNSVDIQWNNTPDTSVTITCDGNAMRDYKPGDKNNPIDCPRSTTITQNGILCPSVNALWDAGTGPGFTLALVKWV